MRGLSSPGSVGPRALSLNAEGPNSRYDSAKVRGREEDKDKEYRTANLVNDRSPASHGRAVSSAGSGAGLLGSNPAPTRASLPCDLTLSLTLSPIRGYGQAWSPGLVVGPWDHESSFRHLVQFPVVSGPRILKNNVCPVLVWVYGLTHLLELTSPAVASSLFCSLFICLVSQLPHS